jgi:hypothetical protein
MLPRRADVSTAMIAHGAKHSRLQIPEGDVVRKAAAAGIDLGVVVAVWIAAVDYDPVSPEAPHVRERHWLVVQQAGSGLSRACRIKARHRLASNSIGVLPICGCRDRYRLG